MRMMIHYLWIGLLFTLFGSCRCNDERKASTCSSNNECNQALNSGIKPITLLICTANIYLNFDGKLAKALDGLRKDDDDLVFLGFQEVTDSCVGAVRNNLSTYKVYGYNPKPCFHYNAWAVYSKVAQEIEADKIALPGEAQGVSGIRSAIILKLPGIDFRVANTHLLGGKFDDDIWYKALDARSKQMQVILDQQPDIILGDFNADIKPKDGGYWEEKLRKYIKSDATITRAEARRHLDSYQCDVHDVLEKSGYVSLFKRDQMKDTSIGGVVDWIYVNEKLQYTLLDSGIIEGISLNLSDHNFPWIRIRIDPQNNQLNAGI